MDRFDRMSFLAAAARNHVHAVAVNMPPAVGVGCSISLYAVPPHIGGAFAALSSVLAVVGCQFQTQYVPTRAAARSLTQSVATAAWRLSYPLPFGAAEYDPDGHHQERLR